MVGILGHVSRTGFSSYILNVIRVLLLTNTLLDVSGHRRITVG